MPGASLVQELALVDTYVDPNSKVTDINGDIRVLDSVRITPSWGAIYLANSGLEIGFPAPVEVAQQRPMADGVDDATQFHGASSVSLGLTIKEQAFKGLYGSGSWSAAHDWNSSSYWATYMAAWAAPHRRPYLFFRLKGADQRARFMRLRGASVNRDLTKRSYQDVQLQWTNPDGKVYTASQDLQSLLDGRGYVDGRFRRAIRMNAQTPGRVYPRVGERDYPPAASGGTSINYRGTVPIGLQAMIRARGAAMTNPRLTITHYNAAGQQTGPPTTVGFVGMTGVNSLPAGQTLVVDSVERTVYLNNNRAANMERFLQPPFRWPELKPGVNQIDLTADSADATTAQVEIMYYEAHLQ